MPIGDAGGDFAPTKKFTELPEGVPYTFRIKGFKDIPDKFKPGQNVTVMSAEDADGEFDVFLSNYQLTKIPDFFEVGDLVKLTYNGKLPIGDGKTVADFDAELVEPSAPPAQTEPAPPAPETAEEQPPPPGDSDIPF